MPSSGLSKKIAFFSIMMVSRGEDPENGLRRSVRMRARCKLDKLRRALCEGNELELRHERRALGVEVQYLVFFIALRAAEKGEKRSVCSVFFFCVTMKGRVSETRVNESESRR